MKIEKIKYIFGVMSMKYELESEDQITAYVSMCLFFRQNIPVVVYSPEKTALKPFTILKMHENNYNPGKVKECLKTIKEVA